MQTFKTKNREAAVCLAEYWNRAYAIPSKAKQAMGGLWWEVTLEEEHPMFRELCDAFMSGRLSLALTAD